MADDLTAILAGIEDCAKAVSEPVAQLADYAIETTQHTCPRGLRGPRSWPGLRPRSTSRPSSLRLRRY